LKHIVILHADQLKLMQAVVK